MTQNPGFDPSREPADEGRFSQDRPPVGAQNGKSYPSYSAAGGGYDQPRNGYAQNGGRTNGAEYASPYPPASDYQQADYANPYPPNPDYPANPYGGGQDYSRADYQQSDYQQADYGQADYGNQYPANADYGYDQQQAYGQQQQQPYGQSYGNEYPSFDANRTFTATLQLEDGSGRNFQLREGRNVIGRGQEAQFRLPDTGVSRRHIEIRWDGQVAMLSDLGSTNGTTVNGAPVQDWQLADGDVIRAGHSEILVRIV